MNKEKRESEASNKRETNTETNNQFKGTIAVDKLSNYKKLQEREREREREREQSLLSFSCKPNFSACDGGLSLKYEKKKRRRKSSRSAKLMPRISCRCPSWSFSTIKIRMFLVGECALTSQILGEKFQPRHWKANSPSQIEDQILFLQKYVPTTRQKIAYFIILGSAPSETDKEALKGLWNRLDGEKKLEKELWFGFGLAVIPALTEEVFGDIVVITTELQGAFVSLDTFRDQQKQKNEEMLERLNSLEQENTTLKTRMTSLENDNTDLNARLALLEERLQKFTPLPTRYAHALCCLEKKWEVFRNMLPSSYTFFAVNCKS